jgi:hypothetical protein
MGFPDPKGGRRFQKEKDLMKCVICKKGETQPGKVTVTLRGPLSSSEAFPRVSARIAVKNM